MGAENKERVVQAPESLDSLKEKALFVARFMSHAWAEIPPDAEVWKAEAPYLAEIYSMNSPEPGGQTGVQKLFEDRVAEIDAQQDGKDKDAMMRKLILDLEKLRTQMERVDWMFGEKKMAA